MILLNEALHRMSGRWVSLRFRECQTAAHR